MKAPQNVRRVPVVPSAELHGAEVPEAGKHQRRQRILYVQRSSGGGSVINLLLLLRYLDRDRFDPTVLFYEPSPYAKDFREAGARVEVLDAQTSVRSLARLLPGEDRKRRKKGVFRAGRNLNRFVQRDWPLARRIARVIKRVGADLVQSSVCLSADRASVLAAGLARVPQVCYVQYFSDFFPPVDVPLARLVEHHLCISEAVRRHLCTRIGIPDGRTSVVYAPVEFSEPPGEEERQRRRRDLGIGDQEVLIVNIGRLVAWKGQEVFLRAFAEIASRHPQAHALVVGGGRPTEQGAAYVTGLKTLAGELNLDGRVTFTGHRDDVQQIMTAADVVVHSSSEPEPLGRVVVEAIALRRPVVATDGGGVPEIIQHGATGLLVPMGNVGDMSRALSRVLANRTRMERMTQGALSSVQSMFEVRTHVKTVVEAYSRIIGA